MRSHLEVKTKKMETDELVLRRIEIVLAALFGQVRIAFADYLKMTAVVTTRGLPRLVELRGQKMWIQEQPLPGIKELRELLRVAEGHEIVGSNETVHKLIARAAQLPMTVQDLKEILDATNDDSTVVRDIALRSREGMMTRELMSPEVVELVRRYAGVTALPLIGTCGRESMMSVVDADGIGITRSEEMRALVRWVSERKGTDDVQVTDGAVQVTALTAAACGKTPFSQGEHAIEGGTHIRPAWTTIGAEAETDVQGTRAEDQRVTMHTQEDFTGSRAPEHAEEAMQTMIVDEAMWTTIAEASIFAAG